MTERVRPPEEKLPPYILAGLAILTAIVITYTRVSGVNEEPPEEFVFTESRVLLFDHSEVGDITVTDAETGDLIDVYGAGDGGFTRTALRALIYNRRLEDIDPREPFIVGRADDGRIILHDPSTTKTIGLDAFGDVNAEQLAALLTGAAGGSLPSTDVRSFQ